MISEKEMLARVERIVDGYYYAAFFKHYRSILRNPEILDLPPQEVLSDID